MFERIGGTGNVVVDERTQDEDDCINFANVGEELVAETFALTCTLDETTDVDHLDSGVHDVLCLGHLRQRIEARVEHLGHADVGVLGGEGIGGGQCGPARERVIEG